MDGLRYNIAYNYPLSGSCGLLQVKITYVYMTAVLLCVFLRKVREKLTYMYKHDRVCRLSSCSSLKCTKEVSIVGNRENETVVGIGEAAGGQGI